MTTWLKRYVLTMSIFTIPFHAMELVDTGNTERRTQKPPLRSQNSVQFEQMKNAWITYELALNKKLSADNYKKELLVHYNDLRKAFHMPPEKSIDKEWLKAIEHVLSHVIEKPYLTYKNKKRGNKNCVVL
jgi:hypothetical protein